MNTRDFHRGPKQTASAHSLRAPTDKHDFRPQSETEFLNTSMANASDQIFHREESGKPHNPYDAERWEMHSIETRNIAGLRECWKENYSERLGQLSPDPLRNAKYLCIVTVALSARAAVRGGLPVELAYSLSDAYCQQIDALDKDGILRLEGIVRNIQLIYATLVAQQKGASGSPSPAAPMVARAKDYIFSHLHGRLTVSDVADAMHTHRDYLNRLFKQSEGMTVLNYILREKITLACNMLSYSDYSYSEIANYLGFASQSHLGNTFRKHTGMTLKQYRDIYRQSSDA